MKQHSSPFKHTGVAILSALALLMLAQNSEAQKFQLTLFGGTQHVFAYGANEDYVLGENDFPVTPAHTPMAFGTSVAFFVTKNLGLEADARYVLSSKVKLTDPSDQDTVELDTAKHYSLTLNLICRFSIGNLKPYLVAGGGIDRIQTKEATYFSAYGFEIAVEAPESKVDPMADFGAGLVYFITDRLGIRLDVRYAVIFADPDKIASLNSVLGVTVRF
ncbi:MAG: outer membrane beta-barrel protein [Candidatus Aminicenantes bacterium]|nr:outer membrane beta-barrel protein [Candidatus Aminicenantes bacterium]